MTPEQRHARAVRLRALIEQDDVRDALESVEADLIAAWRGCFDAAQRDALWHSLHAFGLLRAKLMTWSKADLSALARGR